MEYRGQTITGGQIDLDGAIIEDCALTDVVLRYSGGEAPRLIRSRFNGCRFEFGGAAGRTIALLQGINAMPGGAGYIDAAFPITITSG